MQPLQKMFVVSLGIAIVVLAGGPSVGRAAPGALDACGGVFLSTYAA